jgi:DNA-binding transcriptional MerR regulator
VINATHTVEQLARAVNEWCDQHSVAPATGQAGERMTERNVRYYRTLGLVDAPVAGGGIGYGEKHLFQLIAIRLLQAQGLPLNRIRDLLLGRTLDELKQIEKRGLAELEAAEVNVFRPTSSENWTMTPLDDEFLVVSRLGRGISDDLRARLLAVLHPPSKPGRRPHGATTKE